MMLLLGFVILCALALIIAGIVGKNRGFTSMGVIFLVLAIAIAGMIYSQLKYL